MQPAQQAMTMATRDLASGFATGHWAWPSDLHAVLFFLQKDGDQQSQNPEAHQGLSAHHLGMVQPTLLFSIDEENLTVPTRREMGEQGFRIRFQRTGSPGASLGERSRERVAHTHDLATGPCASSGRDHMDGNCLAAPWPGRMHTILLLQACQRVTQFLPAPSLLGVVIRHAQPAVARDPGREEKRSVTCGTPQACGTLPPVQQDRGSRPDDGRDGANARFHQRDRDFFVLTHVLLSIPLWSQGTPAIQQDGASSNQALADDPLLMGGRMMRAQAPSMVRPFGFLIVDSSPGHEGICGSSSTRGLGLALLFSFDCMVFLTKQTAFVM